MKKVYSSYLPVSKPWATSRKMGRAWLFCLLWAVHTAGALVLLTNPSQAQKPARKSDDLVNSIGVNTHFTYTDKPYFYEFDKVKVKLGNSGIRHIRDGITTNPDIYTKMQELYTTYGIRMLQIVGPRVDSPTPWNGPLDTAKIDGELEKLRTTFLQNNEAIEGPNEYDITNSNPTATDPDWTARLGLYTKTLWEKVQRDPVLRSRPVVAPSMAHAINAPAVGNLSEWITYGNMHPYPGGVEPSGGLVGYNITNTQKVSGNKIIWATETGYHNAMEQAPGGHYAAPENVAAKFGPRLVAEYFRLGIGRTYFYEFLNEGTDPANQEDNFGLIRNDLSEKPIYWALKATIDLLKDQAAAQFLPGVLDYTLQGDISNVRQVLLQKSNGTFYLLLWQEVPSYNRDTRTEIEVADRPLTLNLNGNLSKAAVYLPTSNGTTATQTISKPTSLPLLVPDQLMILELTPVAAPDLIVKDVRWSPGSVTAGTTTTFKALIKNQGILPTPAGTPITVDFKLDDNKNTWTGSYTDALAPGDSVLITASTTWKSTFGAHTLSAQVNKTSTIFETSIGNNTQQEGICVAAQNGKSPALISISSPVAGDTFNEGSTISIQAQVACGSAVKIVVFYNADIKIGEDDTMPYSLNWKMPAGLHTLTAKALDANNKVLSKSTVSIRGNALPDLIVTNINWSPANPVDGTPVTLQATVKNKGNGHTPEGTVIGVAFFVDGGIVNWSDTFKSSLAPSDSVVLTANGGVKGVNTWLSTVGSHTITAFVDDVNRIEEINNGNNTLNKPLCVSTTSGAPIVSISAPAPNTTVYLGTPLIITANAADCTGSITLVEFFANGKKLGQTTQSPYSFTWTNAPQGSYALTAVVTNAQGKQATSAAVEVLVFVDRTVGGLITARGEINEGEGKVKAFDNDTRTKWLDVVPDTWIQYQFAENAQYVINQYLLTSANDADERDPKNWNLQGSNDGTNWVTLDSRTNENFLDRFQTRSFSFANTTAYAYYRFEFSNSSGEVFQIAEIELIEAATPATARFATAYRNITETSQSATSTLVAYPNPLEDKLTVAFPEKITRPIQTLLLDAQGKTIYKATESGNSTGKLELDLSKQPLLPGIYYLKVRDSKGKEHFFKLLKK